MPEIFDVLTYEVSKVSNVLDVGEVFENINTITASNVPAGVYEVKGSTRWAFDRTNRSAFSRYRINGGDWYETEQEPKDAQDVHNDVYLFPYEHTAMGDIVVELELRKENGAGTLDVLFCDLIIERKK